MAVKKVKLVLCLFVLILTAFVVYAVAPVMQTARITPSEPVNTSTLKGYCNGSDGDGGSIVYFWNWTKNGVVTLTGNSSSYSSVYDDHDDSSINTTKWLILINSGDTVGENTNMYCSKGCTCGIGPICKGKIESNISTHNFTEVETVWIYNASLSMSYSGSGDPCYGIAQFYYRGQAFASQGSIGSQNYDYKFIPTNTTQAIGYRRTPASMADDTGWSSFNTLNYAASSNMTIKMYAWKQDPTETACCSSAASWSEVRYSGGVSYDEGIEYNVANLSSSYTNQGENWTLSCLVSDASSNSSWLTSSAVNINWEPDVYTTNITPTTAYADSTLRGYCNATDNNADAVKYYWQWFNNTVEYSSGNDAGGNTQAVEKNLVNISSSELRKGDRWNFTCWADDGKENSTRMNATTLLIRNSIPTQGTPLLNSSDLHYNYSNSSLVCYNQTTKDNDSEDVTVYYTWFKSGAEQTALANYSTITHGNTTRGDSWICQVEINDSETSPSWSLNSSAVPINGTPPDQGAPILNSSDLHYNYSTSSLKCYNQSTSDYDGDDVTSYYTWYKDGTEQTALENQTTVGFDNTSVGEAWICQVDLNDTYGFGVSRNSSAVVLTSPPGGTPSGGGGAPADDDEGEDGEETPPPPPPEDNPQECGVGYYLDEDGNCIPEEDYEEIVEENPEVLTSGSAGGAGAGGLLAPFIACYRKIIGAASVTWETILKEEPRSVTINRKESSLGYLEFQTTRDIPAAYVHINVFDKLCKPPFPVGEVYQTFTVTSPMTDSDIETALVEFKVGKGWLETFSGTIALQRLEGQFWRTQRTELVDEDNDYFYYESEIKGFSRFAITSSSSGGFCGDGTCQFSEDKISCPEDCSDINLDTLFCLGDQPCLWRQQWFLRISGIGLILGFGLLFLTAKKKKDYKKKKKKKRFTVRW